MSFDRTLVIVLAVLLLAVQGGCKHTSGGPDDTTIEIQDPPTVAEDAPCSCRSVLIDYNPDSAPARVCFENRETLERRPWCIEDASADAQQCPSGEIPVTCRLGRLTPQETVSSDRLSFAFGFGYKIFGQVTGNVGNCQEGQLIQRTSETTYNTDDENGLHDNLPSPTAQPAPQSVPRGLRVPGTHRVVTAPGQRPPFQENPNRRYTWGADGYTQPNPANKYHAADRRSMWTYDAPSVRLANPPERRSYTSFQDRFRILFFLGSDQGDWCWCPARYRFDFDGSRGGTGFDPDEDGTAMVLEESLRCSIRQ
ncbi:MAG: hypothetical protein HQ481_07505 [Alphaproteobacteria bacterium]|nr:hypothetical protein [Alphaproteobacteria bacterium]